MVQVREYVRLRRACEAELGARWPQEDMYIDQCLVHSPRVRVLDFDSPSLPRRPGFDLVYQRFNWQGAREALAHAAACCTAEWALGSRPPLWVHRVKTARGMRAMQNCSAGGASEEKLEVARRACHGGGSRASSPGPGPNPIDAAYQLRGRQDDYDRVFRAASPAAELEALRREICEAAAPGTHGCHPHVQRRKRTRTHAPPTPTSRLS